MIERVLRSTNVNKFHCKSCLLFFIIISSSHAQYEQYVRTEYTYWHAQYEQYVRTEHAYCKVPYLVNSSARLVTRPHIPSSTSSFSSPALRIALYNSTVGELLGYDARSERGVCWNNIQWHYLLEC